MFKPSSYKNPKVENSEASHMMFFLHCCNGTHVPVIYHILTEWYSLWTKLNLLLFVQKSCESCNDRVSYRMDVHDCSFSDASSNTASVQFCSQFCGIALCRHVRCSERLEVPLSCRVVMHYDVFQDTSNSLFQRLLQEDT